MTKREHKATRSVGMLEGRAQVECLNCNTTQRADEDGDIQLQPCHADDCSAMLCANCEQFICDHCGLAHCMEHANVDANGVKVCDACREAAEEDEAQVDCYCAGDHCNCGRVRK